MTYMWRDFVTHQYRIQTDEKVVYSFLERRCKLVGHGSDGKTGIFLKEFNKPEKAKKFLRQATGKRLQYDVAEKIWTT